MLLFFRSTSKLIEIRRKNILDVYVICVYISSKLIKGRSTSIQILTIEQRAEKIVGFVIHLSR